MLTGSAAAGRQVLQAVDPLGTHLQVQVLHVLDHHLPGSRRRGRVPTETICYCRVSSPKQRDDLQRQVVFMRERYPDARVVTDVGGGLNFQRKGLGALLERLHRGDKLRIVVAHRDRLARFGFDLIRWMAEQNGGEIVVLGDTDYSPQQELTEDIPRHPAHLQLPTARTPPLPKRDPGGYGSIRQQRSDGR